MLVFLLSRTVVFQLSGFHCTLTDILFVADMQSATKESKNLQS